MRKYIKKCTAQLLANGKHSVRVSYKPRISEDSFFLERGSPESKPQAAMASALEAYVQSLQGIVSTRYVPSPY